MHDGQIGDRRVRRTRAALLDALGALLHEKPYDAIVVKEILERANVGRSTFYAHFRDKDALLRSGLDDVLRRASTTAPSLRRSNDVLRFALPILEHVERQRRTAASAMGARGREILHERLRERIAETLSQELGRRAPEKTTGARHVREPGAIRLPLDLVVRHVTSTFVLILTWWMESGSKSPPKELDALFRALAQPAIDGAFG